MHEPELFLLFVRPLKSRMECGGKAQRRRRFGISGGSTNRKRRRRCALPPHSINTARYFESHPKIPKIPGRFDKSLRSCYSVRPMKKLLYLLLIAFALSLFAPSTDAATLQKKPTVTKVAKKHKAHRKHRHKRHRKTHKKA